jgi:hypothetical protein
LVLIPGLNWGTGLLVPFYLLLVFGWKKQEGRVRPTAVALPLLLSQITLTMMYFLSPRSSVAGGVSGQPFQLTDIGEMLKFVFFGISYSIVGRSLFPLASRIGRMITVSFFFLWVLLPQQLELIKKSVKLNWRIVLMGLSVLVGSYFLISLARFRFGLGQAGAPRYAYMPMMFLVIAVVSSLAKIGLSLQQKKSLLLVVMLYTVLSLGAFTQVTVKWTERPQKNRALFGFLQNLKPGECLKDDFIPWYIVETDKWTLKDLWPIFGKNFDPFTGGENCIKINRDVTVPFTMLI